MFVYGSLKRGEANHAQLGPARFIGVSHTDPSFGLREIDGYPALVPGDRAITGELYEVSSASLPMLDEFEGATYQRRAITLSDGSSALAYVASEPWRGVPLVGSEWPDPERSR